ncbi:MAG: radical SAM protein [Proteobacteria bacterium]|nr:radical SAM protein [Pseudomonadota bacterium]MBU1709481.1 radical SAM protein [Pseudomonadota bacterium]
MEQNEHPDSPPTLVFANSKGQIQDFPDLYMAGRSGRFLSRPDLEDLIPLPEGSEFFVLPGRKPIGIDKHTGEATLFDANPDAPHEAIQAVAAFMAPAHTAFHSTAYEKNNPDVPPLPLFAYTAIGWHKGRFWVSAFRSDPDIRQEAEGFDYRKIRKKTNRKLNTYKNNRLVQHLGKCCLTYSCPAAKNFFLERFEAPLPTSPVCNANCIGCISLQPSECCPSTQDRITFVPTPGEIAELALSHISKVKKAVVSFGQGCEGEPLLQWKTIGRAISLIRKQTDAGTININSNSSLPEAVAHLIHCGLDSLRVSINSARKEMHQKYYRPSGFSFDDVRESIRVMKDNNKFVSLNYFILPGFTDDPDEFKALCDLLDNSSPDMIQLRNLNMDPDWYFEELDHFPSEPPLGMRVWLNEIRKRFPRLRLGYYNPPLR